MSSRGLHYTRCRVAGRQAVLATLPQTSHVRLTREDLKQLFLPSGLSHLIDRVWSCKLFSLRIFPRQPQVRSQDFSFFLKNTFSGGKDFFFLLCLINFFWGTKELGSIEPMATGLGSLFASAEGPVRPDGSKLCSAVSSVPQKVNCIKRRAVYPRAGAPFPPNKATPPACNVQKHFYGDQPQDSCCRVGKERCFQAIILKNY